MKPNVNPSIARLSQLTLQAWRVLRNPRFFASLALLLLLESLAAFSIPQKPTHFNSPTDFVDSY